MPPTLEDLLLTWETNYKKGLLSFWMLLVLHDRPAYALELGGLVEAASGGSLSADENSIYRAANRFESLGLIEGDARPSPSGPPRRYYRLTPKGRSLLKAFTERNITTFQRRDVRRRIQAVLANETS
jgi:PadR family transcriptional regulator PadR